MKKTAKLCQNKVWQFKTYLQLPYVGAQVVGVLGRNDYNSVDKLRESFHSILHFFFNTPCFPLQFW